MHDFADLLSSRRRALLKAMSLVPALGGAPSLRAAGATEGKRGAAAFDLGAVRLLPGPFETARALDARYMLSLDADRLLHNFRVNAGLPPKAPVYGGWESEEPWVSIRCHGHTLGHYLSACALMAAATGEPEFRRRVDYIVGELQACQEAGGSGMVSAFPDGDTQLRNGLAGRRVTGVPWYTQHKLMAGLRDARLHLDHAPALAVLRRLADWIDDAARDCDEVTFQRMLQVEHGGMNEVLADLFVLTDDKRYLALAQRFNHRALVDPLAEGRDTLDGLHSNTQIPKVIGFQRLHQLTGERPLGQAARYFWGAVAERRSFATGGNGDGEHFFPVGETRKHLQSAKTMETCCTHNMLRLTRALYLAEPTVAYADYYERALFNSILASQDPLTGMMTYFQSLRPGYPKLFHTPERSFWCCTGTGMENHAKYGDSIYFHADDALFVNLFIASELRWPAKGLRLVQHTGFPDSPQSRFTLHLQRPARLALRLRHPAWCRQVEVMVNGRRIDAQGEPGRWVTMDRLWRDGDVVTLRMPMHLHLAPLPGDASVAALMLGPVVLAARMGQAGITPGSTIIINERESGYMLQQPMDLPRLALGGIPLEDAVRRRPGADLAFTVRAASPEVEFELVPFHRIAGERYNLYWQI